MVSRYGIGGACFAGLLLVVWGCAAVQPEPTYVRALDLDWDRNDTWAVSVQFWPERRVDPYTRTSRVRQRTWTYRVVATPKSGNSSRYKVRQSSDSDRYLLLFGDRFSLLEIHRLLEPVNDFWKTRRVRDNRLGNGAFFYRSAGTSHPPVVWYHPALNREPFDRPFRMNYTRHGRATGDWITQRVTRTRGGLVFELVHSPSSTRVAFFWRRGEPWWRQAEWYHRERLIALAKREPPPQRKEDLPETPVPALR